MSFQTLEAVAVRSRVARVDLLPPEYAQDRRSRRVRVLLAGGLLAVFAACVGAAVVSDHHVSTAEDSLAVEQAKTTALQAEQAQYSEVPEVNAALTSTQQVKDTVGAGDVPWYAYLDRTAVRTPDGVVLTSTAFALSGASQSSAGAETNPLAVTGIGTVTITGQTTSLDLVSNWLDSMSTVPGYAGVALTNSSADASTGVMTFNATIALTSDALASNQ